MTHPLGLKDFEERIYYLLDNNENIIGMVCRHKENPDLLAIYQPIEFVESIFEVERLVDTNEIVGYILKGR